MSSLLFAKLTAATFPLSFQELVVAALLRCPDHTGGTLNVSHIIGSICPEEIRRLLKMRKHVNRVLRQYVYIERLDKYRYRLKDGWQTDLPYAIVVNGAKYRVAQKTYNVWARYLSTLPRNKSSRGRSKSSCTSSSVRHMDTTVDSRGRIEQTHGTTDTHRSRSPPLSRNCRMFSIDELLRTEHSECTYTSADSPSEVTIYV